MNRTYFCKIKYITSEDIYCYIKRVSFYGHICSVARVDFKYSKLAIKQRNMRVAIDIDEVPARRHALPGNTGVVSGPAC